MRSQPAWERARERWLLNLRKSLLGPLLPLLRILPPRAASNALAALGRVEYRLSRGLRHRFDRALTETSHHFGTTWDVREIGRELAGNQLHWRARDLLLDGLAKPLVDTLFEIEGRSNLRDALAEGRGVVLLCSHFGSHMMPAHWLAREGYPLRLFMERPRTISRFLARDFDSDGPTGQRKLFISRRSNPKESAGAIMRATRVLNAGMILMIAGDVRWSGAQTSPAEFLGKSYTFSNTWVRLASIARAPIVPVFCRIATDRRYVLEFQERLVLPEGPLDAGQTDACVGAFLRRVEKVVERYPSNSADYFFWEGQGTTLAI
ncbi:MAG: lysophospholipid acyltransferase family protein [Isosphaeraceae bacterium]